jgi:hypothetical protein
MIYRNRLAASMIWLAGLFYASLALPGHAAEADQIEDLLQERWFEVELIIFERFDVLDANSGEALTLSAARAWPHDLLEFYEFGLDAVQSSSAADQPLTVLSPYCLGFPTLRFADPVHPSLQPSLQAADENFLDGQTGGSVGVDDGDKLATNKPIEPPLNAPQLTITPYLQLLADVAEFEQGLYASSYRWLENLTLVNQVKAINRQSNLRPLIHRRWRQPVPERDNPLPIYLSSGSDTTSPLTRQGFAKLEGHVAVTVGRYLHFAPTLWYHADNLGLRPIGLPVDASDLTASNNSGFMQLAESRRLRSGDLHYLDHPKIGVIVRIDPIQIPQTLLDARQSLDELSQDGFQ